MIVVLQRVLRASVTVDGAVVGSIGRGVCLLVCAVAGDDPSGAAWLADKCADLRVFADAEGRSNLSLLDVDGAALVVPQFTLAADWRKGRRPSFVRAAPPSVGEALVRHFVARLAERGVPVEQGRFGAAMQVDILNDGPFTLVLEDEPSPGRAAPP